MIVYLWLTYWTFALEGQFQLYRQFNLGDATSPINLWNTPGSLRTADG